MTIENLAQMAREDLHQLCMKLELDLTGNRTVLMGRVAGVLTSQKKGWGKIKRSLRRNGIQAPFIDERALEGQIFAEEVSLDEESFQDAPYEAVLEDASDSIVIGLDKQTEDIQGDLLTIQARVEDLERMVGTILRSHGGTWGDSEKDLLLRLARRRGWPIKENFVRLRLLLVATNIAEVKGAILSSEGGKKFTITDSETTIDRIRSKLDNIKNS